MKKRITAIFTVLIMLMSFIGIQPCQVDAEALQKGAVGTDLQAGSTIEISTLEELEAFRDDVNSGNTYDGVTVTLTADIDMSGRGWEPIGISYEKSFRGIFDGGGHKIKNLYINSKQKYQGLFGFTYGATIKKYYS